MKVLVVGTGAREHAIADALKDDVELYCYMSKVNPGISKIAKINNQLIAGYLTRKYDTDWKSDLKIIPFGIE